MGVEGPPEQGRGRSVPIPIQAASQGQPGVNHDHHVDVGRGAGLASHPGAVGDDTDEMGPRHLRCLGEKDGDRLPGPDAEVRTAQALDAVLIERQLLACRFGNQRAVQRSRQSQQEPCGRTSRIGWRDGISARHDVLMVSLDESW